MVFLFNVMLNIHKLSKSFGAETILAEVSFVINPGDRVGLVGPNGSGKSTLLQIAAGVLAPDSGSVSTPPDLAIGYLAQGMPLEEARSVREVILDGIPGWTKARAAMDTLAEQAAAGEEAEALMAAYGDAQHRFETLGGYRREHEAEIIAAGLGLPEDILDREVRDLSGGQRTRVGLARILIATPDLLLLDEPTNHLDIAALEWLEESLTSFHGGVLVVSHDRVFLDRIANRIIAIDAETHTAREYTGNYSDYAAASAAELEKTWQTYRDQQDEIRRMEADIHRTKMQAKSVELTTTSGQPTVRRYAKKVARKALSREKKLARFKDSDERVQKPTAGWRMKLDFDETLRSGRRVLRIEGLQFAYPQTGAIISNLDLSLDYGERVVLIGDNGSGKSTLLKIIAGDLAADAGSVEIGAGVRIGYMPQEQESLPIEETPLRLVQGAQPMSETEARNFLHYYLFEGDAATRRISQLSYGERARLLLAVLVVRGSNFLVLDEPINHLDIPSRERFEAALAEFPGTVLAAVHDRAFIRNFGRKTLHMHNGTVRPGPAG